MPEPKNKKKYYKSVIQIEILSDEPYEDGKSLDDIKYDINEGHCSGILSMVEHNQELNGFEMARALESQGSDPEFFGIDQNGEDLDEDDEEITSDELLDGVETKWGTISIRHAMIDVDGTNLEDGLEIKLDGELVGTAIGFTSRDFSDIDSLEKFVEKHAEV
jgi:hypothetical protein